MSDPTAVYSVSVDSRTRNANDAENNYSIDLRQTLQRVKSVRLGSVQIPESRYTFTEASKLGYMEPIVIPANCYVFVEETTTVVNRIEGSRTVSTNRVAVLLPPTLNRVTGFTLPNTVVVSENAGLDFALTYYPQSGSVLRVSLVGGHYPQSLMTVPMPVAFPSLAGPVLTSATVVGLPPANTYTYVPGYLAALNTAGDDDVRHYLAANYTSYVYAEPALPVELFSMLNVAFDDLRSVAPTLGAVTGASFAAPVVVTSAAPHGLKTQDQVLVLGVTGNTGANGSFFVVVTSPFQFELGGSTGTAAYTGGGSFWSSRRLVTGVSIGFDDAKSELVFRGDDVVKSVGGTITTVSARLLAGPGSFAELIGFTTGARASPSGHTALTPFILRSVSMQPGNYNACEVATILQRRMCPLLFDSTDSGSRTLFFILPSSPPWMPLFQVVLPQGRYTASQLTDYINFYTTSAPLNVSVLFNAATGCFTFSHNVGLVFGLDFSSVLSACLAFTLGFEAIKYLGMNTYTSSRAVFGVTSGSRYPVNVYRVGVDESRHHFSFSSRLASGGDVGMISASGVNTAGVDATWEVGSSFAWMPLVSAPVAQSLQAGDVVRVSCPFFSDTIVDATFTSPIVVTTASVHGLSSTDSVSLSSVVGNTAANGLFSITVTGATTFELDGSVGNAAYVSGGVVCTTSVLVGGVQVATNEYTGVVKVGWDASGGTGLPAGSVACTLVLEPTASLFSVLDSGTVNAAVGTPSVGPPLVLVRVISGHRSVFQLMFFNKAGNGLSTTLGFPAVAWPPFARALQNVYRGPPLLLPLDLGLYESPLSWFLKPPPYILMLLRFPGNSGDMNTHVIDRESVCIFAKLYLKTCSYLHITDELLFTPFATVDKIEKIGVEFRNPDGSLVEFNGVFHSFTLLFTVYQGMADGVCF